MIKFCFYFRVFIYRSHLLASWVNLSGGQLADVQVSWVLGIGGVAVVAVGDDGVEEVLEESVGLLVTSDGTDSLDHWVTLVVDTSFDAVSELDAQRG